MKNFIVAFIVGLLFAFGLGISGMTQPMKVIGFLDLFGNWDPSLMFVMIGAISVHAIFYLLIRSKPKPVLDTQWHLSEKTEVTRSLVIGSMLFGIGWGLAGYCPGPAITSVSTFETRPILFVVCMIAGMLLFRILDNKFKFKK